MSSISRKHVLRLSISLLVAASLASGCDSKDKKGGGEKADDKKETSGASETAKKAEEKVTEMSAKLEKGEDIKYACAGNLAMYKELASSENEGDKKAWAGLSKVCHADLPNALIAELRSKMEKGELGTTDTVDLETTLKSKDFPTDGEPAKIAAEAKKVLEVEIPTHMLNGHLETAKKEKEEGKSVSMGCIKAKQVVEKSGEALSADEKGKASVASYNEACPQKG